MTHFGFYLRNLLLTQGYKEFLLCFLPEILFLDYILGSMILSQCLVYGETEGSESHFCAHRHLLCCAIC